MARPLSSDALLEGTVTEVDLSAATVRVAVGDIETIMIPWGTTRAGACRIWNPPVEGEQVYLRLPEGDWEAAYVAGSLFSDHRPPPDDTGKTVIMFDDGAVFSYDHEASALNVDLAKSGSAVMKAPGGINITADMDITGDMNITGDVTVSKDVTASGVSLVKHKHGLVKAGTDKSGKPE